MNAAARQLLHAAALLVLAHCALVSAISSSPPLPPSPPPGTCLPNSNYTICFAAPSHGTGSPSPAGDCTLLDTAMVNGNINWANTQRFCGSSPPAGVPAVPSSGPNPAFYYCTTTTALTDYAMKTLTISFSTSSTLFLNSFVSGYNSHSVNASALWVYFSCRTASPMPSGTSAASWGLPYAYTLPKLSPAPSALSFPSPHSSSPMPPPVPLPTGTLLFRVRNHDTLLCLAAPSSAAAGTVPTYQANCSSSDSYWLFNAQSNLVHQKSGLCLSRQGTIDQFSNAFLALSASCDMPLVPLAGSPSNRLGVVLQEQYLPKWCLHAYGGYAEPGAPPVLYNDCVFESRIELDLVPVPPTPELAGSVFIAPLGCYKDTPSHLLSTVRLQHAPNMTPALCANLSLGQMYFGVQNGTDCYSGSYLTDAVSAGESAACNTPCSGDSNQTCGGVSSNNIYLRSPAAIQAFTLGCYLGTPQALLSTALLTKAAAMSVDRCSNLAASEGFAYFGVFNGTDCYGGDNLTLAVAGGLSITCNVLCSGFAENCGGVDSTRIYKLLTVTPPPPPPSPPPPQPSPPSPRPSPPSPPSPHSPPPSPPSPHSPPPSPSPPRPRSPPPPRKPSPPPRPRSPPPHPPPPSPMATLPCSVCTTYRLELDVKNPGPMWSGPVPPLPSSDTCSTLASYMTGINTGSAPLTFACTAVTVEQFNHGQVKACAPGSGADTAMAVAMFHAAGDSGFNLLVYQALSAIGYAGGEPYTFLVQDSCGAPANDFYSSIMT